MEGGEIFAQKGYNEEFVEPMSDDYECPICHFAMRDPMLTKCGHQFCKSCLLRISARKSLFPCPQCGVELNWLAKRTEIFPNMKTSREILSLQVMCRLHNHDCPWTGELRLLETHVNKECLAFKIDCINQCGHEIRRSEMDQHVKSDCSKRPVNCEHCAQRMSLDKLENHCNHICSKKLVECHLCGAMVCRSLMKAHLSEDNSDSCPKAVIACRYARVGCNYKCVREDMGDHLTGAVARHTDLLLQDSTEKDGRIAQLDKALNELTNSKLSMELYFRLTDPSCALIWALTNWSDKPGVICTSSSFYTGHPGYKIYFVLRGATFTVNFQKGDYDQQLQWSKLIITMTILDQSEKTKRKEHIVEKDAVSLARNSSVTAFDTVFLKRYERLQKYPHKKGGIILLKFYVNLAF
ncbi:TNF receptor-associated factor 6-like isoform X2 [Oscarella lobularis]|uniref:TNF receptor-associated factor 6-like isoform X2 n=1 Tax=Oscarella lobularis TaxID=121494 RepID=UPI003314117F